MNKKPQKSQIKKIQKESDSLRKTLKKLELRPCKHNSEILQKEKEIEDLEKRIKLLEIERERYIHP